VTLEEAAKLFAIVGISAVNRQIERLEPSQRIEALRRLESSGHWEIIWHGEPGSDGGLVWEYIGPAV
jgi:hypothetical protein